MANPISAMMTLLREDSGVMDCVSAAHIYGGEFPKKDAQTPSLAAVVINAAGGATSSEGAASYIPITNTRMDVFCYGKKPLDAFDLFQEVDRVFRNLGRDHRPVPGMPGKSEYGHVERAGVLLYNAIVSGGPIQTRDPDDDWPFVLSVYDVTSALPGEPPED